MAIVGTAEAAKRLGVSARRVAAMITKNVLRAEKVGKTWVISEAEIARVAKLERPRGRPKRSKP